MTTKAVVIATMLLLSWAPQPAFGEPELFVGAKGGANFSWITGPDWDEDIVRIFDGDNKGRFGATLGGFVSAVFPSRYGIRVELLYTEHGGRVDGRIGGSDAEIRVRTVLLDTSFLGERYFDRGPGRVSVFLGPTLLFLQGDILTETRADGEVLKGGDVPEAEQVFGATGGVGYVLPLGPGILLLDARYTRGLTGYNRDKAYDNALTFLVGYGLPF
ncbi:MAG: outer membrane beta-barrel protein [Spirochaetaceae bacterium]